MVLPTEATEIFSSMMGCIFNAIVYIVYFLSNNIPFTSSLGPVYQKEVKWSAFSMERFFAHANNSFSQERLCLGLIWKVRVFGTFFWKVAYLSGVYVVRKFVKNMSSYT